MQRHAVHTLCGGLAAIVAICSAVLADESKSISFRPAYPDGTVDRVEFKLEAIGHRKQLDPQNALQSSQMQLVAAFQYDERMLVPPELGSETMQSVRYYRQAAARMKFDDDEQQPSLNAERRVIVVDVKNGQSTLFSPAGPLTREELELIDTQGSSLLVEKLLPTERLAMGETWTPPQLLWAPLLGLDIVAQCEAEGVVVQIEEETALLELAGVIEGAVDGAETEIEVRARMQFNHRLQRLTWFAMVFKEKRSVGHVGPALEVTARIQISITPTATTPELSDASLARLDLRRRPEVTKLSHQSPSGAWRLLHDRDWVVTADDRQQTIFRLVDRGEFVAQCNVTRMPKVDPAQMVTLEKFQQDIEKSLGESFKQLVSMSQRVSPAGYGEYRVVIDGESSGIPLRWTYYLVTDREGHQTMLAFVVEANLIERLGENDRQLVDALRLTPASLAASP